MTVFEKHKRWLEIMDGLDAQRAEINRRIEKATEDAVDAAMNGDKNGYTTANFEREIAVADMDALGAKAAPFVVTCEEITAEWAGVRAEHNSKMVKAARELMRVRAAYMKAAEVLCSLEEAANISRHDYIALARVCGVGDGKADIQIAEHPKSVNWDNVYQLTDHRNQKWLSVMAKHPVDIFYVGEVDDIL